MGLPASSGNSQMKLHCCSLFQGQSCQDSGEYVPTPFLRLGWVPGTARRACFGTTAPHALGPPTTMSLNMGPDPAVSLGQAHTAAQQMCAE